MLCHEKPKNVVPALSVGYIDLSKRRVSPEEAIKCEDKFTKSKTVSLIVPKSVSVLFLVSRKHYSYTHTLDLLS